MMATGKPKKRQRALSCTRAEQEMIRRQARAAGKTHSQYVIDLVAADNPHRHPLTLSEEEQRALRDGTAELAGFARALRDELGGGGALGPLAALAVLAHAAGGAER